MHATSGRLGRGARTPSRHETVARVRTGVAEDPASGGRRAAVVFPMHDHGVTGQSAEWRSHGSAIGGRQFACRERAGVVSSLQ